MRPIERQDRLGTLLLMVLLTLVMLIVWWAVERMPEAESPEPEAVRAQYRSDAAHHQHTWQLRPFDPNTASEDELRSIGFSEYHVRNLMRYRSKGGKWRSVEHFSKLYGLSHEDFERLRPYIQLPATAAPYRHEAKAQGKAHFVPRYEVIDKLQAGEQIDLATADTSALKRIPGIGGAFARCIVAHRAALGGFISVEQLNDIPDLPANVTSYCHLSTTTVQPTDANTASYSQLIRHPYLNTAQVRAIISYREQYGRFRTVQQLLGILPATEAERQRLRPYIVCL